jgi:hypothetical protein
LGGSGHRKSPEERNVPARYGAGHGLFKGRDLFRFAGRARSGSGCCARRPEA